MMSLTCFSLDCPDCDPAASGLTAHEDAILVAHRIAGLHSEARRTVDPKAIVAQKKWLAPGFSRPRLRDLEPVWRVCGKGAAIMFQDRNRCVVMVAAEFDPGVAQP